MARLADSLECRFPAGGVPERLCSASGRVAFRLPKRFSGTSGALRHLRSSSNGEPKGSLASGSLASFPPPHDAVRSTAKEMTKWNHASRGSQPRPWVSDPYEGIQAAHFGAFANPSGASGGAFVLTGYPCEEW